MDKTHGTTERVFDLSAEHGIDHARIEQQPATFAEPGEARMPIEVGVERGGVREIHIRRRVDRREVGRLLTAMLRAERLLDCRRERLAALIRHYEAIASREGNKSSIAQPKNAAHR